MRFSKYFCNVFCGPAYVYLHFCHKTACIKYTIYVIISDCGQGDAAKSYLLLICRLARDFVAAVKHPLIMLEILT